VARPATFIHPHVSLAAANAIDTPAPAAVPTAVPTAPSRSRSFRTSSLSDLASAPASGAAPVLPARRAGSVR
jgi:hypothetical protein